MSKADASPRRARVFINMPYGTAYQSRLVAYTAALVSIGRFPLLTFLVTEEGQGRLKRIFELMMSCPVSIHDLSAVGMPVRFNMPFELGLACALRELRPTRHKYLMVDSDHGKPYALWEHLSDVAGIDYKVHDGNVTGAIRCILQVLDRTHDRPNPSVPQVLRLYQLLNKAVPDIKHRCATNDIFSVRAHAELVAVGFALGKAMKL